MASKKYVYRCKANPSGPLLVLETYYEHVEMANHPDYERIDEFGEVIVDEKDTAEQQIPIDVSNLGKRAATT